MVYRASAGVNSFHNKMIQLLRSRVDILSVIMLGKTRIPLFFELSVARVVTCLGMKEVSH